MSVATELTKLNTNIKNAYDEIATKGGTVPQNKNTDNLATAISSISGGGGSDWSEIGYTEEPDFIQTGIDYGKQIQNNWDSSVTYRKNAFLQDYQLMFFPEVDTSKITNARGMFQTSSIICLGDFDFSNITDAREMFMNCKNLFEVGDLNFEKSCPLGSMFYNCTSLRKVKSINITSNSNSTNIFSYCSSLQTVEKINTNLTNFSNAGIFYGCSKLDDDTLKEILKFLKKLTEQTSSNKKLSYFGLSTELAQKCTTFNEWTELANDGWTTGY